MDFFSFAKSRGTHATKVAKNLTGKYGQKLLDSAKKSTTDLIGNKIANKITGVSKKSSTRS